MIAYHVTSAKKLRRYIATGYIRPPVRAWRSIADAERFSKQTGRRIILRLALPGNVLQLEGHRGAAVVFAEPYSLRGY